MNIKVLPHHERYSLAIELLKGKRGRLLDIGARNKILLKYLRQGGSRLSYESADCEGLHDYLIDLEHSLSLKNEEFDYVVALDVLEHVDRIHDAFTECLRIAKREVIVGLPNMASLSNRWRFLKEGTFGTGKYDLNGNPPSDRHRWVTTAKNSTSFIKEIAEAKGWRVSQILGSQDAYSISGRSGQILYSLVGLYLLPPSLYAKQLVFHLVRK